MRNPHLKFNYQINNEYQDVEIFCFKSGMNIETYSQTCKNIRHTQIRQPLHLKCYQNCQRKKAGAINTRLLYSSRCGQNTILKDLPSAWRSIPTAHDYRKHNRG